MKSQYPMTTHNHITSVLNILQKEEPEKWLIAFPPFTTCIGNCPGNKKTNHTANQ